MLNIKEIKMIPSRALKKSSICWTFIFGVAYDQNASLSHIISIMVAIMSTAIVIYFGDWIKSIIPIKLIVQLLLVQVPLFNLEKSILLNIRVPAPLNN